MADMEWETFRLMLGSVQDKAAAALLLALWNKIKKLEALEAARQQVGQP